MFNIDWIGTHIQSVPVADSGRQRRSQYPTPKGVPWVCVLFILSQRAVPSGNTRYTRLKSWLGAWGSPIRRVPKRQSIFLVLVRKSLDPFPASHHSECCNFSFIHFFFFLLTTKSCLLPWIGGSIFISKSQGIFWVLFSRTFCFVHNLYVGMFKV